mmetsp:Transcript_116819/g.326805  ORF Transcript_116819/g.326805 Transcript_116819/m.326805 type:complete len:207 (-) Transcript_116819:936-1556(-)
MDEHRGHDDHRRGVVGVHLVVDRFANRRLQHHPCRAPLPVGAAHAGLPACVWPRGAAPARADDGGVLQDPFLVLVVVVPRDDNLVCDRRRAHQSIHPGHGQAGSLVRLRPLSTLLRVGVHGQPHPLPDGRGRGQLGPHRYSGHRAASGGGPHLHGLADDTGLRRAQPHRSGDRGHLCREPLEGRELHRKGVGHRGGQGEEDLGPHL